MRKYYCYVYFDEQWNAYYVGKGSYWRKSDRRKRSIPVADEEYTQVFYFSNEWEAFECERELISFWGRRMDGGSLMNVSLGGVGTPGVPNAHNALIASQAAAKVNRVPITLTNIQSNEIRTFPGIRVAAKELQLNCGCLSQMRLGRRKTHKGWRITDAIT